LYKPRLFVVETVLGCNLQCPGCPIGVNLVTRKKKLMDWDTFIIIADKIKPYAEYVYLHEWGEPLLHPRIIDMVEYLKPIRCGIATNGQLVTDDVAKKLAACGVDVMVSLDGYTQEVYEKYRAKGDVKKAYKAVELLLKHDVKDLAVRYVTFKHNQHELDSFMKKMNEMGIKNASPKVPFVMEGCGLEYAPGYVRETPDKFSQCVALTRTMTVGVDGTVHICCNDYNMLGQLGSLMTHDVLDIYNSEVVNNLRRDLKNNLPPEVCKQYCWSWRTSRK